MKDTCWRVSLRGDVTSPICRTRSSESHKFGLRIRPQSHYRFILDDIGRDLTSFETTKELVETLADALQGTQVRFLLIFTYPLLSFTLAHTDAFQNAKILHRGISVGNIIISSRGGLLIDWDLAKDTEDLEKISRQPFRTVSVTFDEPRPLPRRF
jgi:hypothetical protein